MAHVLALLVLFGLVACNSQTDLAEISPTMTHTFDPLSVDVGEEISGVCQSWTLNNEELS